MPSAEQPRPDARSVWAVWALALAVLCAVRGAEGGVANTTMILLGQSASFSGGVWEPGSRYNAGLLSAFKEINDVGGVHGRPVRVLTIDDAYIVVNVTQNTKTLLATPDIFAFIGFMGSGTSVAALNLATPARMPMIGSLTGTSALRRTYSELSLNVRSGYDDEALAMLKLLVEVKRFRKISVLYQNDAFGAPSANLIRSTLKRLGLRVTGFRLYEKYDIPTANYTQLAVDYLSEDPQAIVLYAVEGYANPLLKEYYRVGGARANATFVIGSWIGDGVRNFLKANKLPAERFHTTQIMPHPQSTNSAMIARYQNAMRAFGDTSFDYLSVEGYVVGRIAIEMLKRTRPLPNGMLTSEDMLNALYETQLFRVDELLMGPYTRNCEHQQVASGRSSMCNCTQGMRFVGTTVLDSNYEYNTAAPDVGYPLMECYATSEIVSQPTLLGIVGGAPAGFADGISAYAGLPLGGTEVVATNANQEVDLSTITAKTSTTFLSVMVGMRPISTNGIVPVFGGVTTGMAHAQMSMTLGAASAEPTTVGYFNILPTIEQELHGIAYSIVNSGSGVKAVQVLVHGSLDRALLVVPALRESLYTFGGEGMAGGLSVMSFDNDAELLVGVQNAPWEAALVVLGMDGSKYVEKLLSGMLANGGTQTWYVLLSELAAGWSAVESGWSSGYAAAIERVKVVSNMPLWTSTLTSGNAVSSYQRALAQATPATMRNPNVFIGYVMASVMKYMQSKATSSSPAGLIDAAYRFRVLSIEEDLTVGPYVACDPISYTNAYSPQRDGTLSPMRVCGCSAGARKMNEFGVGDLFTTNGMSQRGYTFQECVPLYTYHEAVASSTNPMIYVAIGIGAVVLLLMAGAVLYMLFFRSSGRNNALAPQDASVPFAIMFTDIQSSTSLWARAPMAMSQSVEKHHSLVRMLIAKHKGYEVKTIGDSFMIAFKNARGAVELATSLQTVFFDEEWEKEIDQTYRDLAAEMAEEAAQRDGVKPMEELPQWADDATYRRYWHGIRVRVGIHWGLGSVQLDPVTQGYDYYGTLVNTAARVEGVGNGGQVLVTKEFFDQLELEECRLDSVEVTALGRQPLRGLDEPVPLYQLNPSRLAGRRFNPLRLDVEIIVADNTAADEGITSCAGGSVLSGGSSVTDMSQLTPEVYAERLVTRGAGGGKGSQVAALLKSCAFLETLLSTSPAAFRTETLRELMKRWNISAHRAPRAAHGKDDVMANVQRLQVVDLANKVSAAAAQSSKYKDKCTWGLDVASSNSSVSNFDTLAPVETLPWRRRTSARPAV